MNNMEKKVMKKELRMCMDYSENDCEKCYDEKDDVATRIVKEIIKSNKEKAERDRQNDGEVENKK